MKMKISLTLAQRQDWRHVHLQFILFFCVRHCGTIQDPPGSFTQWGFSLTQSSNTYSHGDSWWQLLGSLKANKLFNKVSGKKNWNRNSLGPCQQPRAHPYPLWLNCQNIFFVVSQYHSACLGLSDTGRKEFSCLQNKHRNKITKQEQVRPKAQNSLFQSIALQCSQTCTRSQAIKQMPVLPTAPRVRESFLSCPQKGNSTPLISTEGYSYLCHYSLEDN